MPAEYTLPELAKLSGVSARTVRYYIAQGLLPGPSGQGPGARYADAHLSRIRLIRKLQAGHLPLAEIRRRLKSLAGDELATLADATPGSSPSPDSALEYIESLLVPVRRPFPVPAAASIAPPLMPRVALSVPSHSAQPEPATEPASIPRAAGNEPERAQWERVSLDPDIELHIRRPLTRQQNRRVERLISIARQLLQED